MTKVFNAARSYDHRTHGRIGIAELVVESKSDITMTLNGTELPAKSIDHLLMFALQTLQDAYAGADSVDAAKAAFNAKLERILHGTLGARTGGEAVSDEVRHARIILRPHVAKAVGKVEWKDLEESAKVAAIDTAYANMADDQRKIVDGLVADAIAAERARAKLTFTL